MEGSDKLLVEEDKNTYNISSVLYNDTGLYFCEASNMFGILSNSTPASLKGENVIVVQMNTIIPYCRSLPRGAIKCSLLLLVHISSITVFRLK